MNCDDKNQQWGKAFVVPPSGGCTAFKPPEGGTTSITPVDCQKS
jgi:hypothetical protein